MRWFDEKIAVRDRSKLFEVLWNADTGRLSGFDIGVVVLRLSVTMIMRRVFTMHFRGLFANAGYLWSLIKESGLGRPRSRYKS